MITEGLNWFYQQQVSIPSNQVSRSDYDATLLFLSLLIKVSIPSNQVSRSDEYLWLGVISVERSQSLLIRSVVQMMLGFLAMLGFMGLNPF